MSFLKSLLVSVNILLIQFPARMRIPWIFIEISLAKFLSIFLNNSIDVGFKKNCPPGWGVKTN